MVIDVRCEAAKIAARIRAQRSFSHARSSRMLGPPSPWTRPSSLLARATTPPQTPQMPQPPSPQIGDHLPQLRVLVLELLQPAHLGRQQAVVSLLPIEIGRLTDPCLPADLSHRHSVRTLLQNERFLGVRKLRGLHRSTLLPAGGSARKTLTKNDPVFAASDHALRCQQSTWRSFARRSLRAGVSIPGMVVLLLAQSHTSGRTTSTGRIS